MIKGLLDTDIVIDLLRGLPSAIEWHSEKRLNLAITPITWMEVIQGSKSKFERDRSLDVLRGLRLENLMPDVIRWAMRQLMQFRLSHGAHYSDCLIASVAVRLDVPLYTRNVKHFAPLPSLDEQQPY